MPVPEGLTLQENKTPEGLSLKKEIPEGLVLKRVGENLNLLDLSPEERKKKEEDIIKTMIISSVYEIPPETAYDMQPQITKELSKGTTRSFEKLSLGDYAKHTLYSTAQGLATIPAGLLKSISIGMKELDQLFPEKYFGDDDVQDLVAYRMGRDIENWAKKAFPEDPGLQQKFVWGVLPRGLGQMIGFYGTGAIGTLAKIPSLVSVMLTGAAVEAPAMYEEAKRGGATEEEARIAARWGAALGTTEALPISRVFNRFNRASGGQFGRIFIKSIQGGLEEMTQEAFQTGGENLVAKELYDKERDLFEGMVEAGGAGGILGFFMNMMAAGIGVRVHGKRIKQPDINDYLMGGQSVAQAIDEMARDLGIEIAEEAAPAPPKGKAPWEKGEEGKKFIEEIEEIVKPEEIQEPWEISLEELEEEKKAFEKTLIQPEQIKQAHAIAQEKGWISEKGNVKPQYRRLAEAMTGEKSTKKMTAEQADEFITALQKIPEPQMAGRKLKIATIPLTKEITPAGFFERHFKEPTLAKYITPSNRYARTLGVYDFIGPSIEAKTAMIIERESVFRRLDELRAQINRKLVPSKRGYHRLRNIPTRYETRMFNALDKFKTAQEAGFEGKDAEIFTELRTLTETMIRRTNEVREHVGLEPIKGMKAYVTHLADTLTRKELAQKYPFPEEIKYWLDWINPQHIYNPTALQRMVEERKGLLRDPIKALKAMVSMDLKQIYLEQPIILFNEQVKAFKGMMPASTRQWLQAYMNEVIKGMPTKLDTLTNNTMNRLGILRMIDMMLKPFGRTTTFNPSKQMAGAMVRLIHDAVIWTKIRMVIRNHTQKFLTLGLYDTKAFAKAMLPASKQLKTDIKSNDFWKISSKQFMEQLPEGLLGKLEKLGFKPYGHSHISNVTFSMKAAYYAGMELVENPKYKDLGWTKEDVLKEMEYGAMTTQYWYNAMGMPEVFRSGATRMFFTLQSWWQNYVTNYWREMLSRAVYGRTGWGKPIPAKWRVGALRHIITSIIFTETLKRLFGLDYRRIALLGTLPAYLSPPGQIILGLYGYITADNERERKEAVGKMKYSWKAFIPGSGAWRDFIKIWKGEMTTKEFLFYTEREKGKKKF